MLQLKKLKLNQKLKKWFPVFYNFIIYNKLINDKVEERVFFISRRTKGNQIIHPSGKPLSKMIDLSQHEDLQYGTENNRR
jgi:hypothetical protein